MSLYAMRVIRVVAIASFIVSTECLWSTAFYVGVGS